MSLILFLELIFIVFFACILGILFYWMISAMRAKVPFICVPNTILPDIEKALDIKGDTAIVYDLGCGDARILRHLARKHPKSNFIGIENSSFPYHVAKTISWWNKKRGYPDNVQILRQDFFDHDLSKATHVFTYLFPKVMDDMLGKLERELPKGARLVSASFEFTHKRPLMEIDLGRRKYQLARKLFVYEF